MKSNDLERVAVLGMGLLGGSVGLAVNRVLPKVQRVGYSHREVTRQKALAADTVDECYATAAEAVRGAQLVVLASPIGTFEELMVDMAEGLEAGAVVTDVGSTKVLPVRWGRKYLPSKVEFLGSHPMAGSEQRGVEFARADLFDGAHCILTPVKNTKEKTVKFLRDFWQALGMIVCQMPPGQHDRVLGRISHLPHVLAGALVNCSTLDEMMLCGKGFLDTTRIASGPPSVWKDILVTNASSTEVAIERMITELRRIQGALQEGDEEKINKWLSKAQSRRNELVEKKLQRKELPS